MSFFQLEINYKLQILKVLFENPAAAAHFFICILCLCFCKLLELMSVSEMYVIYLSVCDCSI